MRHTFLTLILILIIFLASCQTDAKTARTINMYNASSDMIGTAKLSETPDGVNVKFTLEGLEPGYHGIHVHEYPKCEIPDFKSAGSHLNPEGNDHGLMNPEGPHLGDMPNIEADQDGLVDDEIMLPEATLTDGKKSLLKGDGTSMVIQEDQDDGLSQPSGNAGARIACGVIKSKEASKDKEEPTDPTDFNDKLED